MDKFRISLFLFFLLSVQLFAQPDQRNFDLFIFGHLSENETFAVSDESPAVNGASYYEIITNSGETFLAKESKPSKWGWELVTDENETKEALKELYRLQGYNDSSFSEIPSLYAHLSSFSASRQPKEALCKQYIGTDRYPCNDRESCYKSCYTPICNPTALGGGWPFIDEIVSYEKSISDMDAAVERANASIQKLEKEHTKRNFDLVSSYISDLNRESTRVTTNRLFTDYQICGPINYNLVSLVRAKLLLERIERESLPLLSLEEDSRKFAAAASEYSKKFRPGQIERFLGIQNQSAKKPQVNASQEIQKEISGSMLQKENEGAQGPAQPPEQARIPILSDFLEWVFSLFG